MALIFGRDIRAAGETINFFYSLISSAEKFTDEGGFNVVA